MECTLDNMMYACGAGDSVSKGCASFPPCQQKYGLRLRVLLAVTQYCIMLRSVGPIFMGREVAATVSLSPSLSLRLDTLSTAAID